MRNKINIIHMVSSDRKKEVLNDWGNAFPQLSKYTPSSLYMKLDVVLIGLQFQKIYSDTYRPLLVSYPLWKSDNKENMLCPIFILEMENKKHLQLDISYERHPQLFLEAVACAEKQVGTLLKEQVHIKDIFNLLEDISTHLLVKNNPIAQSRLFEYKLAIALFLDNEQLLDKIKSEIEKKSNHWESDRFERLFTKTIIEWQNELFEKFNNRKSFIDQINHNLSEKKMSGLKVSHMLS